MWGGTGKKGGREEKLLDLKKISNKNTFCSSCVLITKNWTPLYS